MQRKVKVLLGLVVMLSLAVCSTAFANGTSRRSEPAPSRFLVLDEDREQGADSVGYIIVGESHASKSEMAVYDRGGVLQTDHVGDLIMGQNLFFVHTLYLMPWQAELHGSTDTDREGDLLFAGASPGWLVNDGCSFPAGSPKAGASALNRIKQLQAEHGEINRWVVAIVQGYSVAADELHYDAFTAEIENFAQQLSSDTETYMIGCPETYIAGTQDSIRRYNGYLRDHLSTVRFYDWNGSWGENDYDSSEVVANHLKLEVYYDLWKTHIGYEIS